MELHAQAVSDPDFAGLFFSILVAGACRSNQNVLGAKCRLYRQIQPPIPLLDLDRRAIGDAAA